MSRERHPEGERGVAHSLHHSRDRADVDRVLAGGGGMGALMRSIDWGTTAIGPVEGWSQALRTMVGLLLRNHSALLLWWGPKFVQLYNDAYRPVLGDKHPRSMGQPGSECWAEIWHIIGPMVEAPYRGEPATTSDDLFLLINRKGFVEETHFRVAYSPVPDETVEGTGVGGVLATVVETTEQVYGERQLRTLRELGARAAEANTAERACANAAETLAQNTLDVPFALFYLVDDAGKRARLVSRVGFADRSESDIGAPLEIDLVADGSSGSWPVARVIASGRPDLLEHLAERFSSLPTGAWAQSPDSAIALPLASPDQPTAYGVLICGVSPHRALDAGYRTFFELAAAQVITAIRNARAYQAERRRAEVLAEIDRAKTVFFSNVSHEFRTPLTLMLGPIEDGLADEEYPLPPIQRQRLDLVRRNGLRLQKLVNTLLDFARIEAGRAQAAFVPTDLAALTRDLASSFRSAVENAGIELFVDCEPLPESIYVDPSMWEKVVLNLLSNAFKFTFKGELRVVLKWLGDRVELCVSDTGTGIPAHELPRIFERFHRVEGTLGRSHEGSGIGLALVHELIKLHGGSIEVESTLGRGSVFRVILPAGSAHLPKDRVATEHRTLQPTGVGTAAFLSEIAQWNQPGGLVAPSAVELAPTTGLAKSDARILVADDNADMRHYVARLLAPRWNVEVVGDGVEALSSGVLIAGASPRRALDDSYRAFFDLMADHIGSAITNARALESERRRAEALAEVDRAKTAFFSNVSHEFRTPLTLILGPVEDALADPKRTMSGDDLEVVRRNTLRLYKMVGTLLDFTRAQAGRAQATFVPTDLATFTSDLASSFRSIAESAGLAFEVDCPPLPEAIYIDPDMWEKIVLNLISNAVKYTYRGAVRVSLRWEDEAVLIVQDTGVGIPEEELPRVFERFYRVRVTQGRSHEGTGIGLALVQELAGLHGGRVDVASKPGEGTTFTVRIPRGSAHLEKERVDRTPQPRSSPAGAAAFLEEASRWAAGLSQTSPTKSVWRMLDVPRELISARVLLADDNADLRAYVSGLLAQFFDVKAVTDGRAALEIARTGWPDIIVSDVMMPEMDGFALIEALRSSESTRSIPVILLTARAGEDSTVEGLQQGADDYLVMPFSARELIARVRTHLEMSRARSDIWRERARVDEMARSLSARDEFISIASHELRTPLTVLGVQLESVLNLIAKGKLQSGRVTGKLQIALRQIDRLTRLIESLLDVSRISLGRLELEPEEFDLATLARQVVEQVEQDARSAGSSIHLEVSAARGFWDRSRLEQVLLGLISNAIKYSPGTPIEVKVASGQGEATVVVRDRGMGIRAEDLGRIFDRFERAVSAQHYGGLGIGLYLARKIIAAHGGTIEVDSSPGRGATFIVRLPMPSFDDRLATNETTKATEAR